MPVELTYLILEPGLEPQGVPDWRDTRIQWVQVTATDSDSNESEIFGWYAIQKLDNGEWRGNWVTVQNPDFENTEMYNDSPGINDRAQDYIANTIVPHLDRAIYPLPPDFLQYPIQNPQDGDLLPRAHPLAELHLSFTN